MKICLSSLKLFCKYSCLKPLQKSTINYCLAQIGGISTKWNHVNGCKNRSDCILLPYNCLIKNPKKANFYSIEKIFVLQYVTAICI